MRFNCRFSDGSSMPCVSQFKRRSYTTNFIFKEILFSVILRMKAICLEYSNMEYTKRKPYFKWLYEIKSILHLRMNRQKRFIHALKFNRSQPSSVSRCYRSLNYSIKELRVSACSPNHSCQTVPISSNIAAAHYLLVLATASKLKRNVGNNEAVAQQFRIKVGQFGRYCCRRMGSALLSDGREWAT